MLSNGYESQKAIAEQEHILLQRWVSSVKPLLKLVPFLSSPVKDWVSYSSKQLLLFLATLYISTEKCVGIVY